MKRKPKMKMRVKINCGKCKNGEVLPHFEGSVLYHCKLDSEVCYDTSPETCGEYFPHVGDELEETFDEDAKGNWFCINCKWYAGGKDDGGECMFNPPVMVSDMGSVRPVTYPYDYCSRWEKEENE